MKTELWCIGKTQEHWLETGIAVYEKRLTRYMPFTLLAIPDVKQGGTLPPELLAAREGEAVLQRLKPDDRLVLLDERGTRFHSRSFADWVERQRLASPRRLVFLIGGAFGFSEALYQRADQLISLSEMTFSHQMVRLFFVEQLYRAMTILRNEAYHND
jgi:23S rRNA (pseudouridine1915-N3)-methyltransferase